MTIHSLYWCLAFTSSKLASSVSFIRIFSFGFLQIFNPHPPLINFDSYFFLSFKSSFWQKIFCNSKRQKVSRDQILMLFLHAKLSEFDLPKILDCLNLLHHSYTFQLIWSSCRSIMTKFLRFAFFEQYRSVENSVQNPNFTDIIRTDRQKLLEFSYYDSSPRKLSHLMCL